MKRFKARKEGIYVVLFDLTKNPPKASLAKGGIITEEIKKEDREKPLVTKLKNLQTLAEKTSIDPANDDIINTLLDSARMAMIASMDEPTRTDIEAKLISVNSDFRMPKTYFKTKRKIGFILLAALFIDALAMIALNYAGYSGIYLTALGWLLGGIILLMVSSELIALHISKKSSSPKAKA